eukprot:scaffold12182_cov60-Phaeocystis_antarctica.AAC.4
MPPQLAHRRRAIAFVEPGEDCAALLLSLRAHLLYEVKQEIVERVDAHAIRPHCDSVPQVHDQLRDERPVGVLRELTRGKGGRAIFAEEFDGLFLRSLRVRIFEASVYCDAHLVEIYRRP